LQAAAARINGTSTIISVASAASTADTTLSAAALLQTDSAEALPEISLTGITTVGTQLWSPRLDLLESSEADLNFVVEVESDGTATVRFGDDTIGRAPEAGTQFLGAYRVGNGAAGNVGADTLTLFSGDPRIANCRNPLPAVGGTDPETDEQIRRRAPQAFLTQQRAVTMDDYAHVAELNPQVDQAVASLRWTGSWYTVFVAADPRGTNRLTSQLQSDIKKTVRRYHLAGQDLEVDGAQYVPLQIELEVCVEPGYFRSDVQRSLLQLLNAGTSASGAKGLFHPDNFTFGTTVYLSPIYAAARSVAGVKAVRASTFQPQGLNFTTQYIDAGAIPIGPLQIARLENDPSLPNHGQLSLVLEGGK
jgi:predicted phage baseplate assembly protein